MKKDRFRRPAALLLTTLLLLSLGAELLVLTSCGKDELQSRRPPAAMVIDGAWSDWEKIPVHQVDEMDGLVVGVANDEGYLYLIARSSDLQLARRLRVLGLVVQAAGAGGSDLEIRYHGSVALSDNLTRAGGGPGGGRMPLPFETGEGSGLPVPGRIVVEQGGRVRTMSESLPDGPAAGSDIEGDVYCYEFRLPLDALFGGAALERGVGGQKVRLVLQSGKMTSEVRQQMIALRNSRGNSGKRGGGPDSGMGGGVGLPGGKPRKLVATVKLAGPA